MGALEIIVSIVTVLTFIGTIIVWLIRLEGRVNLTDSNVKNNTTNINKNGVKMGELEGKTTVQGEDIKVLQTTIINIDKNLEEIKKLIAKR